MFSHLHSHFNHAQNPLYQLKTRLIAEGHSIMDAVSGNVTQQGIRFPEETLRAAIAEGITQARTYAPDPLGHLSTREAISHWYAQTQQTLIPAQQLVLTPGTSLSYWYVFQLLANPGDDILCPLPNYPLFDAIARLAHIQIAYYPLSESRGWKINIDALTSAITPKTRAIVLISPHNPTGVVASAEELAAVVELARKYQLPLIVDEVFSSFLFKSSLYPRLIDSKAPLVFTLNGFSKMLALPGIKLGWIGVTGAANAVEGALRSLDAISDTFLPVADPLQYAAALLLPYSSAFQASYQAEMHQRVQVANSELKSIPGLSWEEAQGGFYTTLRLPPGIAEDALALHLLKEEHVLMHPGYFYDLEGNHLILSHVGEPRWTQEVIEKLRRAISTLSP